MCTGRTIKTCNTTH